MLITLPLLLGVSPWLANVYDYRPAPGQFMNELPEIEALASHEEVIAAVAQQITGAKTPGMISLGSFGGYVTVGFDHPVVNVPNQPDFKIYGNSMTNGAEPGIIMVSRDMNGNGIPDDEWYELKGSLEDNPDTRFNYKVTYFKPDSDKSPQTHSDWKFITDSEYIHWEGSDDQSGYIMKLATHTQSYWPEWLDTDRLEFTGTRLPDLGTCSNAAGTAWTISTPEWGYVDSQPNNVEAGFDISNAIDSERNPVNLPQIDFIRIYTGVLEYRGWLGEASTEIAGGEDLHPDAGAGSESLQSLLIASRIIDSRLYLTVAENTSYSISDLSGKIVMAGELIKGENILDISHIGHGIYLAKCGKVIKFVI